MKTFYLRYDLNTGEGIGSGWSFDLDAQQKNDPDHGYIGVNFTGLSASLFFVENGVVEHKTKLDLNISKEEIKTNGESTIISWNLEEPVKLIVNGHLDVDQHIKSVEISTQVSGPHYIQISHPRYYSDKVRIMAVDEED